MYNKTYLKGLTDKELEAEINGCEGWDAELSEELCDRAGMTDEWNEADEDTAEEIIYAAAEKLGINI